MLRVHRNACVGDQVDAKNGAESVIAIWHGPQRHAMHLDRRKLASCLLVQVLLASSRSNSELNLRAVLKLYAMAWPQGKSGIEARGKKPKNEYRRCFLTTKQEARSNVPKKQWEWCLDTGYHVIEIWWPSGVEVNDNQISKCFLAFNLKYLIWTHRHLLWDQSKCCRLAWI